MASMLMLLLLPAILHGCQVTGPTPTNAIDRIRQDICSRAWRGVTTSRHDVLTDQTALEIAQDTAARKAYCGAYF